MSNKKKYIEEEALIVKHSGEIPEVVLHGSVFFLTTDPDGPRIHLETTDLRYLKKIVVERYCEIIRRDLDPANRDKTIYRGLARSYANWNRLNNFCDKENFETGPIQSEIAAQLMDFMINEINEVQAGTRTSCINLSVEFLRNFFMALGVSIQNLPTGWERLCVSDKP